MARIVIDRNKCKGCLLCIQFCPKGSLKVSSKLNARGINPVEWDEESGCVGCAICAVICPDCCITVHK